MGGGRSERGRNGRSEYGQPKKCGYDRNKGDMAAAGDVCVWSRQGLFFFFHDNLGQPLVPASLEAS